MNGNSQLLSRDAEVSKPGPALPDDCAAECRSSLGSSINLDLTDGHCSCGVMHMSSHNAVCNYCARMGKVGKCGSEFN